MCCQARGDLADGAGEFPQLSKTMLRGDDIVKDHGIGKDGHRHALGLLTGFLVQQFGNRIVSRRLETVLEQPRRLLHGSPRDHRTPHEQTLRDRDLIDAIGKVAGIAGQPPLRRPSSCPNACLSMHAVLERGVFDSVRQVALDM